MALDRNPQSANSPKDITQKQGDQKQSDKLVAALVEYLQESRDNAREWQERTRKAWDMIHGKIDWSHKKFGQSKVHLNRVGLAQEQIKAQIKQGLMNFDEWLVVENEPGFESDMLTDSEAKRMVMRGIRQTNPKASLTDNIGIAVVENLLATKLQPMVIEKRGPGGTKRKEFHIKHISLNIRNYYPDATMSGLYAFHEVKMPKHKLLEMSADEPTPQKPYFKKIVKTLEAGGKLRIEEDREERDRGNDIKMTQIDRRKMIVLHEFWGTVLDENGEVMEWKKSDGSKMKLKDVIVTMADEGTIIDEPRSFPNWDGCSNFIDMQLLRSNINKYGRGLIMPGVDMNKAEDELLNAGIDAAKKEAYNVNVVKVHGLSKIDQVSGGIKPGSTLLQNNQLAPGEKLVETAKTGQVPQGLLQVLGIVQSAGAENMRLNEVALSGNLPSKQVRATELVASQQTIQGLFESVVSDIEDIYVEQYAKKVFNMMLQNAKLLTDEDLAYIFYNNEERMQNFKSKSARALFNELGHSFRFRGKGIRSIAQNSRIAQAIINLTSVIVANPLLLDAFERQGIDMAEMMGDVIKGVGLDIEKYKNADTAAFAQERQLIREEALANAEANGENVGQQGQGPNTPQGNGPSETEPGSGAGL